MIPGEELSSMVRLNMNEITYDVAVEPHWTLHYVLREKLGLSGTKQAYRHGNV